MRREAAQELANALELDLFGAGVCLACLTFVAFPLDLGHEQEARREARKLAPDLWAEGLELTTMLALENARREGVPDVEEAIEEVARVGPRSVVVQAIVWRLAELMVEDMHRRKEVRRQSEPNGASASIG